MPQIFQVLRCYKCLTFQSTEEMARQYIRYCLTFYEEKEARKSQRADIRDLDYIWSLPREQFLENYKVSPELVNYLCKELYEDLAPRTWEGLPVHIKVLTGLRILINGHYQRDYGEDQNTAIAATTVSKYLKQFVTAVNKRLKPKWMLFPGREEVRHSTASGFQQKFGLPNILGAIDCTRVTLFPPPGLKKNQNLKRLKNKSINVQLIADADCRILNVNANYQGRVHNQFIFNNSVVKQELKRLHNDVDGGNGDYYLLGDSNYDLEPWLMTPIKDAEPDTPDARYTDWHCEARKTVEKTIGCLKGTFRVLGQDRNLHYTPEKASSMIYAACTLYNVMKHFRTPMTEAVGIPLQNHNIGRDPNVNNDQTFDIAMQKRNTIVQNYFS